MSSSSRSWPPVPRPARLIRRRVPTAPPCCWPPPGTIPADCVLRPHGPHLCATAPIPASSGKTIRHRLNPGGDRQASHALWQIVITPMSSHPTRAYAGRRAKEGLSKKEIIRCLIGDYRSCGPPGPWFPGRAGDGHVAVPL